LTPTPPSVAADGVATDAPVVRRIRLWELLLVTGLVLALYLPKLGSYSLWDPWETHYGEVARRMLEDHDWIRMRWQHEDFRSKPVLTFWLMSAGMKIFGVGEDGGFSGELVSSPRVEWALRLPFALFGVAGVVLVWFMMARLYSRTAAWLSALVVATCPYYFFISRQAITDMPSCAMLLGSMALLALALFEEDRPLPRWRRLTPYHAFLAVFSIVVLGQLLYFTFNLGHSQFRIPGAFQIWAPLIMIPFYAAFLGVAVWSWVATKTTRQVYMYFFYLLNGMAVLAKGPVSPALAGLTILAYLALTGEWKLLLRVELVRGLVMALVVALPWHFAIYCKDGAPWFHEYVNQHILNRAFSGVHGDRGTFAYFLGLLGVGMWPWIALVPAALGHLLLAGRPQTTRERLRVLVALWAIVAFWFFSFIQTKFHHYILPAVPAFGILVALWLSDLWQGRVRGAAIGLSVALGLFLVTSLDLVPAQQKLVHLFIYRYDRPWPKGPPWNIDFTWHLLGFACALGATMIVLLFKRLRRIGVCLLAAGALAFAVFAMDVLMVAASPHWGQRALHEVYYKKRVIHGVDLRYDGLRELASDWESGADLTVRSVIPETLHVGDAMKLTYSAGGETGELDGQVASVAPLEHRFTISVPQDQRAKLAQLLDQARTTHDPPRRRWVAVNADRMVAWQLFWRGENFYSGGEIWNPRLPDMQTAFNDWNDSGGKKFTEYVKKNTGRKFWTVTEKGRIATLRSLLPTQNGKDSLVEEDNSCNKFALVSFTL
jgi:4-amino-4-deoxy-L-arabinose transferase-like glycosyltransferase